MRPALRVVAVTVLTSMDQAQLSATGVARTPEEQVRLLGRMAINSGIGGLVCFGHGAGIGFRLHRKIRAVVDLHDAIPCLQRQTADQGDKCVEIHGVSCPRAAVCAALLISKLFDLIIRLKGNGKISRRIMAVDRP